MKRVMLGTAVLAALVLCSGAWALERASGEELGGAAGADSFCNCWTTLVDIKEPGCHINDWGCYVVWDEQRQANVFRQYIGVPYWPASQQVWAPPNSPPRPCMATSEQPCELYYTWDSLGCTGERIGPGIITGTELGVVPPGGW